MKRRSPDSDRWQKLAAFRPFAPFDDGPQIECMCGGHYRPSRPRYAGLPRPWKKPRRRFITLESRHFRRPSLNLRLQRKNRRDELKRRRGCSGGVVAIGKATGTFCCDVESADRRRGERKADGPPRETTGTTGCQVAGSWLTPTNTIGSSRRLIATAPNRQPAIGCSNSVFTACQAVRHFQPWCDCCIRPCCICGAAHNCCGSVVRSAEAGISHATSRALCQLREDRCRLIRKASWIGEAFTRARLSASMRRRFNVERNPPRRQKSERDDGLPGSGAVQPP